MPRNNVQKNKQSGVALISVLLVFALATVIASEVVSRNYRDIRRTANAINSKQAYYYSLGGEQLARQILYSDLMDSPGAKADTLLDTWAQALQPFEIENGRMSIEIIDLQGRFNLNNLRSSGTQAVAQFRALLDVLDISTDYTPLLQDWLDDDSNVSAGGAEDESYQSRRKAYLAANREMADRSELRLLNNLSFEDYDKLKEYVVALPEQTKYNLNTLDAKIVEALSSRIDETAANNIHGRQLSGGYDSVNQWLSVNEAKSLASIRNELDVQSQYYEVVVKTVYDERTNVLRTQLFRDNENGEIRVIKRQQGFE
jgi:general secretion pathway protein K